MDFFEHDGLTALQAKEEAQRIAFAPFVFQATRGTSGLGSNSSGEETMVH